MNDLYNKLVDLYAGKELPVELSDQMELAAYHDPKFSWEMHTLSKTVDLLHSDFEPEFTEESYQRVLNQIYSRADAAPVQRDEKGLQYQLPISI